MIVPQGNVAAKFGAASNTLAVVAGKFYSAVWNGKTFRLMTDVSADDRAKAQLTVCNRNTKPAPDLKTVDGKLSVVGGVKPGESGNRAMNGIIVDSAVFGGNEALAIFKGAALERGNAYAIVVTDSGSSMTVSSTTTR